jgi:hypothetical protein
MVPFDTQKPIRLVNLIERPQTAAIKRKANPANPPPKAGPTY